MRSTKPSNDRQATVLTKSGNAAKSAKAKGAGLLRGEDTPQLMVRSSAIHAAGCYTLQPIRNGQTVLEYDGARLSKKEADERYADRPVTYLFGFGDEGVVIDGFGTAMFLNHCCAPNCETEEEDGRVFIRAIRDIAAGEELVYEYHLYDSDDDEAPCYCGAPNCRGTMFSEAEVQRKAKQKARKAAAARRSSSAAAG